MTEKWSFHNPVALRFGCGALNGVGDLVAGRAYALVTYGDPPFAPLAARVAERAGAAVIVIDEVTPNPEFRGLEAICRRYGQASPPPEVIVALGGGSVIDSAKVLAAAGGDFGRVRRFVETGEGATALGSTPIIAVPTTAGTGSEVTAGAALWDVEAGRKHSLSRPALYPEHALVDPELLLGLPRSLTVSTGLDALSHALESLWNRNANPVSGALAVTAAREILEALPAAAEDPGNIDHRVRMARAAVTAGLAMSGTKTALAHALSYPITLRHGVPHGLACAFSLPLVMRAAIGRDAACDAALARIFGPDLAAGAARLAAFLEALGVSTQPAAYGVEKAEWREIAAEAFNGERGKNYIGTRERFDALGS